jgi:hypothetical protein
VAYERVKLTYSVCNSQKTYLIPIIKNTLIFLGKKSVFIVRVMVENITTLRGQNAEFFSAKAGGTCKLSTTGL